MDTQNPVDSLPENNNLPFPPDGVTAGPLSAPAQPLSEKPKVNPRGGHTEPNFDLSEHRVPMPSASVPANLSGHTVAPSPPPQRHIDLSEHRVPVQSASLPSNISDFPDDSEAVLVLNDDTVIRQTAVLPQPPKPAAPFSPENYKTAGQMLLAARHHSGMTLDDAERKTHIKMQYLTALERDDSVNLPQQVYITAYIRSLCSLYHVSPDHTAMILTAAGSLIPTPEQSAEPATQPLRMPLLKNKQIPVTALLVAGCGILGLVILSLFVFSDKTQKEPVAPAITQTTPVPPIQQIAVQADKTFKTSSFRTLYPQIQRISQGEVAIPQQ